MDGTFFKDLNGKQLLKDLNFCHKINFLIPLSLQLDVVNLRYLKLRQIDLTQFIVYNSKGLRH